MQLFVFTCGSNLHISKHEICIMFKVLPRISFMLKHILIFKISIIAEDFISVIYFHDMNLPPQSL